MFYGFVPLVWDETFENSMKILLRIHMFLQFCKIFDFGGRPGGSLELLWGAFGPRPQNKNKVITFLDRWDASEALNIGPTLVPNAKFRHLIDVLYQMHRRLVNTRNYKGKVARPTVVAESGEGDTRDPCSLSTKIARRQRRRITQPTEGPLTTPPEPHQINLLGNYILLSY